MKNVPERLKSSGGLSRTETSLAEGLLWRLVHAAGQDFLANTVLPLPFLMCLRWTLGGSLSSLPEGRKPIILPCSYGLIVWMPKQLNLLVPTKSQDQRSERQLARYLMVSGLHSRWNTLKRYHENGVLITDIMPRCSCTAVGHIQGRCSLYITPIAYSEPCPYHRSSELSKILSTVLALFWRTSEWKEVLIG